MTALAPMPRSPAPREKSAEPVAARPRIGGREKAAIIVRLLLSDGGGIPLQGLPEHLQADLTEQIGSMRAIDRSTLRHVVEEFLTRLESVGLSFPGGIEGALKLLDGHISADAASRLKRRAAGVGPSDPWERIAAFEPERLLPALTEESVEVGAVLLSMLPVSRAADLLGRIPGDRARRLAYAISRTGGIAPATVRQIGLALLSQLDVQPVRAFDAAPHERIGAILNLSPAATRDGVLSGLVETDERFADQVRRAIFTFADIPQRIAGRDVSKITRGVDQPVLLTALAGARSEADSAAAEFILANLSQRLAGTLREEMAERGAVRDKDADAAMTALVAVIRDLEAAGELTLRDPDEDA